MRLSSSSSLPIESTPAASAASGFFAPTTGASDSPGAGASFGSYLQAEATGSTAAATPVRSGPAGRGSAASATAVVACPPASVTSVLAGTDQPASASAMGDADGLGEPAADGSLPDGGAPGDPQAARPAEVGPNLQAQEDAVSGAMAGLMAQLAPAQAPALTEVEVSVDGLTCTWGAAGPSFSNGAAMHFGAKSTGAGAAALESGAADAGQLTPSENAALTAAAASGEQPAPALPKQLVMRDPGAEANAVPTGAGRADAAAAGQIPGTEPTGPAFARTAATTTPGDATLSPAGQTAAQSDGAPAPKPDAFTGGAIPRTGLSSPADAADSAAGTRSAAGQSTSKTGAPVGISGMPGPDGGIQRSMRADGAASKRSGREAGGAAEKIAGSFSRNGAGTFGAQQAQQKRALAAEGEVVTFRSSRVGTDAAEKEAPMSVPASTAPALARQPDPAAAAVLPTGFDGLLKDAGSNSTGEVSQAAHRAVDAALAMADHFSNGDQRGVSLKFSVSGVDLSVRVEMRADGVHTTFRTDSPELRSALAQEWQSVVTSQPQDRPQRLADPVFTSTANGSGSATSSDAGAGQYRGARDRQEPANAGERPAYPGARAAATPAPMASARPAPMRTIPLSTVRHLHTFA